MDFLFRQQIPLQHWLLQLLLTYHDGDGSSDMRFSRDNVV